MVFGSDSITKDVAAAKAYREVLETWQKDTGILVVDTDNETNGHEQITTEDWETKCFGVTSRAVSGRLGDESTFAEIWEILKKCLEDNLKSHVNFMDDNEAMGHDCDLTSCEGDM